MSGYWYLNALDLGKPFILPTTVMRGTGNTDSDSQAITRHKFSTQKPGYQCLIRSVLSPKTFTQWVQEDGNVYIGSNLGKYLKDPSLEDEWGNRSLDRDLFYNRIGSGEYKILYEEYIRQEKWDQLETLGGKTMGCWCLRADECHASILMKLFHEKMLEKRMRGYESEY